MFAKGGSSLKTAGGIVRRRTKESECGVVRGKKRNVEQVGVTVARIASCPYTDESRVIEKRARGVYRRVRVYFEVKRRAYDRLRERERGRVRVCVCVCL